MHRQLRALMTQRALGLSWLSVMTEGCAGGDWLRELERSARKGFGAGNPPGFGKRKPPAHGFSIPAPSLRRHQGRTLRDASRHVWHAALEIMLQHRRGWGSVGAACPDKLSASSSPLGTLGLAGCETRPASEPYPASATDASGASLAKTRPGNLSHGRGLLSRTKEEHNITLLPRSTCHPRAGGDPEPLSEQKEASG